MRRLNEKSRFLSIDDNLIEVATSLRDTLSMSDMKTGPWSVFFRIKERYSIG